MIKGVPYDAEVEYLESTGTQYINTGWTPVRNAKLSIDFAVMMSGGDPPMQGGCFNNGGKPYYLWYWTGSNQSNYLLVNYFGDFSETSWGGPDRYTETPAGSIRRDTRYIATYDGVTGVSTLNDDVFQGGACNSTPSVPFFLYARNNRGVAELFSKLKVYGFSVDVEGVKILDFRPVRVGTVGYMYDRVSRRLFGNAGTGAFVLGPDVATPVMSLHRMASPTALSYVQNGLVAMWDGIENAGWGTHGSNLPVDLIGGIGNFSLSRASATVDENSVVISSKGRIVTPSYRIGNQVLTMQMRALHSGGPSSGELGALWENPWFGINLRPAGPGVRFTCGQDIDFLTDIAKAETYTLVRGATKCTFYKGDTLLGQQNISITSIATRQLAAGNWPSSTSYTVTGNLFALRFYNRELSAEEIARNYAIDRLRFGIGGAS